MAKNKIRLPSGMGGLTSFQEGKSEYGIKPSQVIAICIIVIILMIILHLFGSGISA